MYDIQGVMKSGTMRGGERGLSSRRSFLAGMAAFFAGGAVLATPNVAKTHETDDPPTDVDILNYALTLEHLEYAFYRDGLETFSERDFERSDLFNGKGKAFVRRSVYEYFRLVRDHESTHVDTLTSVIQSLDGTPVPEATYNFGETAYTSLEGFVELARFLENTGVSAYAGAIAYIDTAELLTATATIATVEARHASYINLIVRELPFPQPFDELKAPREICEAIQEQNGGFIVSTPEPYGSYRDIERLCRRLPETVLA